MIRHVASIAEIVENVEEAARFYQEVLGLKVQHEPGSPYATIEIAGTLHFGLWARRAAAETLFGDPNAVDRVPLGFSVGFEVDSVEAASTAIESKGWSIVQRPQLESWGQTTSRFLAPGGGVCEIAETPWARQISK